MLGASVWLVSDVTCQQSIQQVRQSRGALHAREHERRSGSGSAAEHGGGTWLACLGSCGLLSLGCSRRTRRRTTKEVAQLSRRLIARFCRRGQDSYAAHPKLALRVVGS